MRYTLVFDQAVWELLAAWLEEPHETAGVLLAGRSDGDTPRVLVSELLPAPRDSYEVRERDGLVLRSSAYVPALKAAAEAGRMAVFVHTHPGGLPRPSTRDETVDDQLRPVFADRTGTDAYASVIIGGSSSSPVVSGQIWDRNGRNRFARARVVGSRLHVLDVHNTADRPGADDEIFDRQIRAFGAAGQRALADLHIGVVGAGGTGSAVIEQLARLGIGRLTLIDDDHVTPTNLTRIYGSDRSSVGEAKVQTAAEHVRAVAPGIDVRGIEAKVTELDAMQALRSCDLVFGCTDDHSGRAVLSRLAYWYLVPVIDMGFVITSSEGRVAGLYGRVTVVGPHNPCLVCRKRIDPAQMREENLDPTERARLIHEGYAQGLGEPDPAVITYTTLVASLAVSEFLARLFGFGEEPDPSEILVRPAERTMNRLGGNSVPDHYCVDPAVRGRGDVDPSLGMLWAD
jgi:molybdopterin/thiamine biosynthesis adenylyltransferase/proteasome lid subunit RPN8/RPN11